MTDVVRLGLKTADGRPLMHKFYRQENEPEGLFITFPGGNYGVDGPLLYYPSEMLWTQGWDTFAVTYGYQTMMEELGLETIPGLVEESVAAVRLVITGRQYPRIGLAGKSIGASVVAHLCQVLPELGQARAAFLSPPLGHPFFDQTFLETKQEAYLAIGDQDRFFDAEALEQLRLARPFKLRVVRGADHSMDVAGDLGASMEAVRMVVEEVIEFVKAGEQG